MLKREEILEQEEKFLKMNAEIEMQTKSLLEEVADLGKVTVLSESGTETTFQSGESEVKGGKLQENSSVKISQITYDLADYFNKIKVHGRLTNASMDLKNNEDIKIEKETSIEKNTKQKRKIGSSAKTLNRSLSTTSLRNQAVFPPSALKYKPNNISIKSINVHTDLISESLKGIGQEGMVRFLTAKVKILDDQVQVMQKEEKTLLDQIKGGSSAKQSTFPFNEFSNTFGPFFDLKNDSLELQAQKDKALEEKDRLIQQVNSAKNVIVKCEQNTQNLVTQLQTSQTENSHLKRELENLKRDMRQNKQNHSANELKLNRTLEESEKLKTIIQQLKQEEKEFKESTRRRISDLTAAIKRADKQRAELLNGFKKQLIIIDNLKRQKGLTDAAKLLKSAEVDFVNFLDCNPSR